MKKLLTTFAVLMLLMPFTLQDVWNEYLKTEIMDFQNYVHIAKEKAKKEGYFTAEIIKELEDNISQKYKINPDKLIIDVTTTPKYRTDQFDKRELIHYKIGIPIEKLIFASKLFNIADENNKGWYIIEKETTSERLLE